MAKLESNPFNSPEFKRQILEHEGITNKDDSDAVVIDTFEEVANNNGQFDVKNIMRNIPQLPKTAKNLILDATALAKNEKEEKARELTASLNNIFTTYNEKYGLDISVDFGNLSNTLLNVSDKKTREVLELYVSEVFKSLRPILLLHLIQRLTLSIDYILQPERMFDPNSFSAADLFLVVEKLMQYIQQLNDMMDEVTIDDSDLILKRIAEQKNDVNLDNEESKKVVNEFMELFRKESLENENK